MNASFTAALKMLLVMTLLTGGIYPLFMTGLSQALFPFQAKGSLLYRDGKLIGSKLISQEFKEGKFFHARPSSVGFNPMPSGGSNLSSTSADLQKAVAERRAKGDTDDLLFASGSGLDPEVSVAGITSQIGRVSKESGLDETALQNLIARRTEGKAFGFLGEERVNVLLLNLDLLDASVSKR
jgi:K+-transporting ATPase ATPase C chain